METDEDSEPTITLTEADARVAAFRQLAAETAERTADYDYSTSPACRCKQAILALSASDAALRVVVAQAVLDEHDRCCRDCDYREDGSDTTTYCPRRFKLKVQLTDAELAATKRDLEAQR